jgi:uncharacterized membrane protein
MFFPFDLSSLVEAEFLFFGVKIHLSDDISLLDSFLRSGVFMTCLRMCRNSFKFQLGINGLLKCVLCFFFFFFFLKGCVRNYSFFAHNILACSNNGGGGLFIR